MLTQGSSAGDNGEEDVGGEIERVYLVHVKRARDGRVGLMAL